MKKTLVKLIITGVLIVILPFVAVAGHNDVVSFGADTTQKQQQEMLDLFGVKESEVKIITVTNQEMRKYLTGLVPDKQLGTRAISSAYIRLLSEGEGIKVSTQNIAWVTEEMYTNALVTAGIENAEIVAAAPFRVSGASALTGIIKAFETATGKKLAENAKKAANEELVLTGDLGDEIGKNKATQFIQNVKEQVVKQEAKNPDEIIPIIQKIAEQYNLKLTDEQIQRISELMDKISKLDLNFDKISGQLDRISASLDEVKKTVGESRGLIEKILNVINNFFSWVTGQFNGINL